MGGDELTAAAAALRDDGWQIASVDRAVSDWRRFVNDVESGYWGTVDDYTNDLTVRDYLERVCEIVSASGEAELRARIGDSDQRYRDATEAIADSRTDGLGQFFRHGDGWWWSRLPKDLGRLADDLGSQEGCTQ